MALDLVKKREIIDKWLLSTLGCIEDYEIDEKTIEHLYRMALKSEEERCAGDHTIEMNETLADEYLSEATRFDRLLRAVAVSPSDFALSGSKSLTSMAGAAQLLELGDVDDSYFVAALNELLLRRDSVATRHEQLNSELEETTRCLSRELKELEEMRHLHHRLGAQDVVNEQQQETQRLVAETQGFDQKAKQYHAEIEALRNKLRERGLDVPTTPPCLGGPEQESPDDDAAAAQGGGGQGSGGGKDVNGSTINSSNNTGSGTTPGTRTSSRHGPLVARFSQLGQLEARLEVVEKELRGFTGLPADYARALEVVARERQKLEDLSEEFEHRVQQISLG